MIYCVWYPSGGFGHFVNAVLTLHGDNFVRPKNQLTFSKNGNSHNLDLIVPKYAKDQWPGGIDFLSNKNYCVLVDNGINNESDHFKSTFPNSTVIKICYTDYSWPVVARTMINKAMRSSVEQQLSIDEWETDEPWSRREKYFLFLRDHKLRHAWQPTDDYTLYIDNLYSDYEEFSETVNSIVPTNHCSDLWLEWRDANAEYINPVGIAQRIILDVNMKIHSDLTHITDLWTQAVIYYYIWLEFNIEVPHNDFANFFTNTDQIMELVA
jgi:hypothetical protein